MKSSRSAIRPFFLIVLVLFFAALIPAQKPIKDLKPTVILIAIDGFRADYFEKFSPPTLSKIAKEGVRAKWMTPSFPSKTFPNHYTVATGLYPAHHGIVENNILDFGVTFSMGKREEVQNGRWWLGQPIWVTAEKQGQRAAAMFFPGTEAKIDGIYSTYWTPYEHTYPNDKRVDNVLGWLDLPAEKRPTMFTMYFSDVDSAGHEFSPDAPETRDAVLAVDKVIARLVDGLKQRKIYGQVNLIFFSDHGMASVDKSRTAILDEYFDLALAQNILWTGEIVQIFPKEGQKDVIAERLKNIANAKCWRKEDIPERLHYKDGPRVAPIICSADEGAMLTSRQRLADAKKRPNFEKPSGAHGYDNELESMRAMFVGHGKAFKKHKIVEAFPNVDVYNLMCGILGLKPAPNDGNFERVRGMLRKSK